MQSLESSLVFKKCKNFLDFLLYILCIFEEMNGKIYYVKHKEQFFFWKSV